MANDNPPSSAVFILPATAAHARALMDNIRTADKREIESFGISHKRGIWRSFKNGLMNKTAIIDGEVVAMWGVGGTFLGDTGSPWLLTSEGVKKVSPLKFARIYQKEVYEMLRKFPRLENWVSSDYESAIRLLMICGFTIGEPEKLGEGMFRKFHMEIS